MASSSGNAFARGNWTPFSFPPILGAGHVFADDGPIGVGGPTLAERLVRLGSGNGSDEAAPVERDPEVERRLGTLGYR